MYIRNKKQNFILKNKFFLPQNVCVLFRSYQLHRKYIFNVCPHIVERLRMKLNYKKMYVCNAYICRDVGEEEDKLIGFTSNSSPNCILLVLDVNFT